MSWTMRKPGRSMRKSHINWTRRRRLHVSLITRELGNDLWRQNPVNKHYDYKLIHSRLQALMEAQENADVPGLIYIIRSGIKGTGIRLTLGLLRNLGNITAKSLFNRAYAGFDILLSN